MTLVLPVMNKDDDRVMICGSMAMNADTAAILDELGLTVSPRMGEPADYVVERVCWLINYHQKPNPKDLAFYF